MVINKCYMCAAALQDEQYFWLTCVVCQELLRDADVYDNVYDIYIANRARAGDWSGLVDSVLTIKRSDLI